MARKNMTLRLSVEQADESKTAMTNAQAELLACTELYLNETDSSRLRVLCSD